jgi:hypothetical protein
MPVDGAFTDDQMALFAFLALLERMTAESSDPTRAGALD